MWLQDILECSSPLSSSHEVKEIISILRDIDSLFFSSTKVQVDGHIIVGEFYQFYVAQLKSTANPYFLDLLTNQCISEIDKTR